MKHLLLLTILAISFMACTKKVTTPSGNTTQKVFYQDADVTVENILVSTATNSATVSFTTAFENNITRIELMSSKTPDTFCTIQSVDLSGDSSQKKSYSFSDSNLKGNTIYYLLRFRKADGNWSYSPYVTVRVK